MSNKFVQKAEEGMGAFERLISGLPGIKGYRQKELRRDADFRLRQLIASQLEEEKQRIYSLQKRLLSSGGLRWTDDVDGAVQKLQTLIDRIKSASYGYAGLFDAQKIKESQLDALHRFDLALMSRVSEVKNAIAGLEQAVQANEGIQQGVERLTQLTAELNQLFGRRGEAISDPGLLTGENSPTVDEALLAAGFAETTRLTDESETDSDRA